MTWKWREGCRVPVRAAVAGAELSRIERRDGRIEPGVVVVESRPDDAPLHPAFEWDDAVAAEEHRREQARRLIRSIEVVRRSDRGEERREIGYVSVLNATSERGYVNAAAAMADPEMSEYAVADAMAALRGWRRRYAHLTELTEIMATIDAAMNTLRHNQMGRRPNERGLREAAL